MNKSKIIKLISAVLLIVMLTLQVGAYPTATNYTYDGTETLSQVEKDSIAAVSSELYESRGVRIAVCVVNSVVSESSSSDTGMKDLIKDEARAIFTEWKVGKGVLLLVSKGDGLYWAVQSESLTDTLSDAKLSEILSSALDEKLKNGDYAGGITDAVNGLNTFLTGAISEGDNEPSGIGKFFSVLLKIIVVVLLIVLLGYGTLVFFEKKKERERRRKLEERRRQAAYRARQGRPQGNRGGYSDGYGGQNRGYSSNYRGQGRGGNYR